MTASKFVVGAIRMPASAASDEPMAHDSIDTRFGRPPLRRTRLRSSTTARIAMPARDR